MTKSEETILNAADPTAYIETSLKSRLPPAAKARLARLWMEKTGYTKEDILRARNRHPYWRKKKMEGSVERTRRRLAAHDYSGGVEVAWTRERVDEFLSLNGKDKNGRYAMKDWQLAEHFHASIPSIQYMRRKCRKVESLLGARASRAKVLDYLMRAESVLKRGAAAVEALAQAAKGRPARGTAAPKAMAKSSTKPSTKAAEPKKATTPQTATPQTATPPAATPQAAKVPAKKAPAAKMPAAKMPTATKAAKKTSGATKPAAKDAGAAKGKAAKTKRGEAKPAATTQPAKQVSPKTAVKAVAASKAAAKKASAKRS